MDLDLVIINARLVKRCSITNMVSVFLVQQIVKYVIFQGMENVIIVLVKIVEMDIVTRCLKDLNVAIQHHLAYRLVRHHRTYHLVVKQTHLEVKQTHLEVKQAQL